MNGAVQISLPCSSCRKCCVVPGDYDDGYFVNLTGDEIRRFGMERIQFDVPVKGGHACQFLGKKGCELEGAERPLACRLFPVIPTRDGGFILSSQCPKRSDVNFDPGAVIIGEKDRHRLGTLYGMEP